MNTFKRVALIFLMLLIWTTFIGFGFMEGFLLRPITSKNTAEAFLEASKKKVADVNVGNFAMILMEEGKVTEEFYFSVDEPVNDKTLFPVASISKWVTSFGVMKLVEQSKLDLDETIETYLTRWQLPESEYNHKEVTIRRLLSHSAGLVDGLGYAGFGPNERIQTIEESLTKAADAPYAEGVARVGYEPGTQYQYSGAAYTILQLLIEEVSGQSFQAYMTQEVLRPLGMNQSTFVPSEMPAPQLAQIFREDGTTRESKRFTALAAAGLFANTADLSKLLAANLSDNKVLAMETISEMAQAETFINKVGIYGLGPHLYSQNDPHSTIIGHDGSGNNAINTAARVDLQSKSGIIILETGNYNLASSLADEWMFWKAGVADYVVMQRNIPRLLKVLIIGYLLIITSAFFIIRRWKKLQRIDENA